MRGEAPAGAVQTLTAPRVNVLDGETRFNRGASEALVTVNTTGASSATFHRPPGPFELYAEQTRLLDAYADVANAQPVIATNGLLLPIYGRWTDIAMPTNLVSVVFSPNDLVAYPIQAPLVYSIADFDPLADYRTARSVAVDARLVAIEDVQRQLDKGKAAYVQLAPAKVVVQLTDQWGMSQLAIARALDVTPTAVRKWRRGETIRREHRDKLAQLAALTALVAESVHDAGGWLEIPLSAQATITPLDLFIGRRPELAVLHARNLADPEETLNAYALDWRSRFALDPDYDVVTLADGSRSAIPRSDAPR